ncbi:hypothetical protein B4W73_08760 [Staphylococcus delphini]|nr:hypothetical protein B5B98_08260 [Staphylococcus delphini]PCF72934.1 hypothetical protein B4W73_08760 [Staphylococcus delphini]
MGSLIFGEMIIKYNTNARFIETRCGKVHDSKTGTHIVPYEKEDK